MGYTCISLAIAHSPLYLIVYNVNTAYFLLRHSALVPIYIIYVVGTDSGCTVQGYNIIALCMYTMILHDIKNIIFWHALYYLLKSSMVNKIFEINISLLYTFFDFKHVGHVKNIISLVNHT